ncbi:hypothetical protein EKI60_01145 [Candidatus Saccharibacteria bacterium]|nr:MAG: hypothetical protein EKI60_01145 [Candidatus Saccharibacteria bacterium]TXG76081.1 MAG: hypothetical protein E6P97_04210 [Patescibacteria group bacterium]
MKEALLDKRIHSFLARKQRQYPDLAQPVNKLTRELDSAVVASPLHTYAKDVYEHDANHGVRGTRGIQLHYAL